MKPAMCREMHTNNRTRLSFITQPDPDYFPTSSFSPAHPFFLAPRHSLREPRPAAAFPHHGDLSTTQTGCLREEPGKERTHLASLPAHLSTPGRQSPEEKPAASRPGGNRGRRKLCSATRALRAAMEGPDRLGRKRRQRRPRETGPHGPTEAAAPLPHHHPRAPPGSSASVPCPPAAKEGQDSRGCSDHNGPASRRP